MSAAEYTPDTWTCPHCREDMPLGEVAKHVRVAEPDCLSCQAEAMIAEAILDGIPFHVQTSDLRFWSRHPTPPPPS